jgi:hypothetical protein
VGTVRSFSHRAWQACDARDDGFTAAFSKVSPTPLAV